MSAQIDFRTLPLNVPSLCIPRVFSNINEARIRRILAELNLGDIARVDVVSNKSPDKDKSFNRVFIHFNKWNTNDNANTARERLINGKDIKIIYDDPWFWKVSAYREQTTNHHRRPSGAPVEKKVSMMFDSDEDKPRKQEPKKQEKQFSPRTPDSSPPRPYEKKQPLQKQLLEPGEISENKSK
jgi:hypothetical protein